MGYICHGMFFERFRKKCNGTLSGKFHWNRIRKVGISLFLAVKSFIQVRCDDFWTIFKSQKRVVRNTLDATSHGATACIYQRNCIAHYCSTRARARVVEIIEISLNLGRFREIETLESTLIEECADDESDLILWQNCSPVCDLQSTSYDGVRKLSLNCALSLIFSYKRLEFLEVRRPSLLLKYALESLTK